MANDRLVVRLNEVRPILERYARRQK